MGSIKAIVLAAGKGTRLHSAEHNQPKALREAAPVTPEGYKGTTPDL